jgi:hypothetical protein
MKLIALILGVAGAALPALAQIPGSLPTPLLHLSTSFDLLVHASYSRTSPLFGPEGERAWAGKHWNPEFIHPVPAHDEQGAVFTVKHGPFNSVWVNSLFDVDGRHFQYVYFMADLMVTVIDVRFTNPGPDLTAVNVVYTRTALTPEGNAHVTAMNESDKTAGKDWQKSIDEYFAAIQPGAPR